MKISQMFGGFGSAHFFVVYVASVGFITSCGLTGKNSSNVAAVQLAAQGIENDRNVGDSENSSVFDLATLPQNTLCTPQKYLELRPDVAQHSTFGALPFGPLNHYLRFGKQENMCKPSLNIPYQEQYSSDYLQTLNADVNGANLAITASSLVGGAVVSMVYRGKQYIDAADHGRELQSAANFDDLGECYNPTEGGGRADGRSSNLGHSVVTRIGTVPGQSLSTSNFMAFWMLPGTNYGRPCGTSQVTTAQNTSPTSDLVFSKDISVGFEGLRNVLDYKVRFLPARDYQRGIFETLTGYMPSEFNTAFSFNPQTGDVSPIPLQAQEQQAGNMAMVGYSKFPIIITTSDRRHSMGIFSPDANQSYTAFFFTKSPVSKWNIVDTQSGIFNTPYYYRHFVTFGTLEENRDTLRALHQKFSGRARGAVSGVTAEPASVIVRGWSCLEGASTPSRVAAYARKKNSTELVLLGSAVSNLNSVPAQVATAANYCPSMNTMVRFEINLETSELRKTLGEDWYDRVVYVKGLAAQSNARNRNLFLSNSGVFRLLEGSPVPKPEAGSGYSWTSASNAFPTNTLLAGQIVDAEGQNCGVCRVQQNSGRFSNLHIGKLCKYSGRWSCFIGNSGREDRYEGYEALTTGSPQHFSWRGVQNTFPQNTVKGGWIIDAEGQECGVCRVQQNVGGTTNTHVGKLCRYGGRWSCFIGNAGREERHENYEALTR